MARPDSRTKGETPLLFGAIALYHNVSGYSLFAINCRMP